MVTLNLSQLLQSLAQSQSLSSPLSLLLENFFVSLDICIISRLISVCEKVGEGMEGEKQIENNVLRRLRISYEASSFCLEHFAALLITNACVDVHTYVCAYTSYMCLYVVSVSICVNSSVLGGFAVLGFVTLPKS